MSVWNAALNEETSLNKKLASSFAQASMECCFACVFNFLLYPMKTTCFYVLCKWFFHVVWQFIFASFFLIKENNPRRGQQLPQTNKAKHGRLTFTWKNIWIQNLSEGVDRFFFFLNRKSDVKRWASRNGNKLSSSVIKLLFLFPFLFKSSGLGFFLFYFFLEIFR